MLDLAIRGGTPIVSGGQATDARPGALLRSGRDTEAVLVG